MLSDVRGLEVRFPPKWSMESGSRLSSVSDHRNQRVYRLEQMAAHGFLWVYCKFSGLAD